MSLTILRNLQICVMIDVRAFFFKYKLLKWCSMVFFQHSEEIYDPEIYRHQISEYYNSYVLDQDIQTGESNLCIVLSLVETGSNVHLLCYYKLFHITLKTFSKCVSKWAKWFWVFFWVTALSRVLFSSQLFFIRTKCCSCGPLPIIIFS